MILCESRPEGSYSCPMIQSSRWSAMVRGGPAVWRAMQQVAGQRGCLRQDVLPHGRAAVAHPLQPGSCGAQQLHRDVGLHPSGPFGDLPETLLDVAAVDGARTAATRSSCFRSSTTCKADLPGGDTLRLTGNGPSSYWNCAGKCRADRGWPLGSERIEELHHDPVCRLVSRKCLLMRLSLLLTPSGAETLVFWVPQLLACLVAPKDVPLMTRRGDLKLSHGAAAKARETAVKQDRVQTTNAIKSP